MDKARSLNLKTNQTEHSILTQKVVPHIAVNDVCNLL